LAIVNVLTVFTILSTPYPQAPNIGVLAARGF
jgi:hypothetical protein